MGCLLLRAVKIFSLIHGSGELNRNFHAEVPWTTCKTKACSGICGDMPRTFITRCYLRAQTDPGMSFPVTRKTSYGIRPVLQGERFRATTMGKLPVRLSESFSQ